MHTHPYYAELVGVNSLRGIEWYLDQLEGTKLAAMLRPGEPSCRRPSKGSCATICAARVRHVPTPSRAIATWPG